MDSDLTTSADAGVTAFSWACGDLFRFVDGAQSVPELLKGGPQSVQSPTCNGPLCARRHRSIVVQPYSRPSLGTNAA